MGKSDDDGCGGEEKQKKIEAEVDGQCECGHVGYVFSKQPILGIRQEWLRGVESPTVDLSVYPLCGIIYFPWHRHQTEGTDGF